MCCRTFVGNVGDGKSVVLSALRTHAPDACIIDEPVIEWGDSLRAMLIKCQFRVRSLTSRSSDGCSGQARRNFLGSRAILQSRPTAFYMGLGERRALS